MERYTAISIDRWLWLQYGFHSLSIKRTGSILPTYRGGGASRQPAISRSHLFPDKVGDVWGCFWRRGAARWFNWDLKWKSWVCLLRVVLQDVHSCYTVSEAPTCFKVYTITTSLPGWLSQMLKMKGPHFHTGMQMRLRLHPARGLSVTQELRLQF